ncbi:uncharacterized protein TNCV_4131921 [Trichonephila clavipes]|nr:uncharacterized protein TNCV_4131921 [Trichonephila clavipes]
MNADAPLKKVFNVQPIGTQKKGRPDLRWNNGLEKDLLVLRTKNWRTQLGRRLTWKRLLEKAKAHPGCRATEEGRKTLNLYFVPLFLILHTLPREWDCYKYLLLCGPLNYISGMVWHTTSIRLLTLLHGDRFNSRQGIYSQFGLAIHQNDHQARRRFVEWAQNEIAVVPNFHKRILFSDEAHFWLNGYVNKQNCRIWSEANPQVYVETPLHPEKLTVCGALWAGGILLQKR